MKHGKSAAAAAPSDLFPTRRPATQRPFGPGAGSLGVSEILQTWVLGRTESAPASLSLPRERMAGIDLLRIMAAVGIIWFHMEGAPHRGLGYAGLPIFLLIFFSLVTRQSPSRTTAQFVSRRWQRLLKPWLFWSLMYGACKLAKAAATADWHPLGEILSVKTLLIGTWVHLWYLPYAFVLGLLIHILNRRIAAVNHVAVVVTATVVGVVTLAGCAVHLAGQVVTPPLSQWEFGLAALPLGLAVGRSLAVSTRRGQVGLLVLIAGATLAVSALLISLGLRSTLVPYSLAIVLVCLAYLWPVRSNAFISAVAPLTFGIYLIHPLVLYSLQHSFLAHGHYTVTVLLTTCLAGAITWALMKTPLRGVV